MNRKTISSKSSRPDIKNMLIRMIATSKTPVTRTDLALQTGLSKMAISNHIAELINLGIVIENPAKINYDYSIGRKPIPLSISPNSPCILGILIKRTFCQSILADISGHIIDMVKTDFNSNMTQDAFIHHILTHYHTLSSHTGRKIIGCGISSLGPVNKRTGCILSPPNFYNLSNIPIASILQAQTNLPTYLIHDADAGALVEKLYGNGSSYENFIYLHIASGIGLGFILNGQLFNGFSGQSGEIGHVSINFNGPQCSCGNVGCLELYASLSQIQKKISELLPHFKSSVFHKIPEPTWTDIMAQAAAEDPAAIIALDDFCSYLAYALANTLKLLDFSTIIIGYDAQPGTNIIENMLYTKLSAFLPQYSDLKIIHSHFNGNAPLLGAIAVIANQIFNHNISLI